MACLNKAIDREYKRSWKKNNKDKVNKEQRERTKVRKLYVLNIKQESECLDCGTKNSIRFHHPNKKDWTGSRQSVRYEWSIQHINEELKKCVPLCNSCHMKRHRKDM